MFRRAILQQTRQFSSRGLTSSSSSAPLKNITRTATASPVILPSVRQWQVAPAYARLRRAYSTETEKKPAEEAKPQEEEKKSEVATPAEDVEKLRKELEAAKKELEAKAKEVEAKTQEARDFKDKFQRAVADFRNLQERTVREVKNAKEFAIQKFAKDLVESVDNFERALAAVPEEVRADAEKNKDLVDLYNGLRMTEEILLNTLKKHGLEKVNPLGEPFDPNKHEATFQVPMPDKEPNTVFHVQQTGFLLNGRTIRAAKVGVVAAQQS